MRKLVLTDHQAINFKTYNLFESYIEPNPTIVTRNEFLDEIYGDDDVYVLTSIKEPRTAKHVRNHLGIEATTLDADQIGEMRPNDVVVVISDARPWGMKKPFYKLYRWSVLKLGTKPEPKGE